MLLALMMCMAPTLGVPHEEMLQDTLKSIIVSGLALSALWLFAWRVRTRVQPLRWHAVVWLPLALTAYALGSMVWSHTFLGGVEAVRWAVFSVIVWLGLNTFSRERFADVAWGIHLGAFGAAVWTALQFWVDLKLFPQGPNPASTFVNRNFVAEFIVCTLPFSLYLLLRARRTAMIVLLSVMLGFNGVALLMTGTRSALVALGVALVVLAVAAVVRARCPLPVRWSLAQRGIAAGVLMATVLALGSIPTGNAVLTYENRNGGWGLTPLARSMARSHSVATSSEYTEGSFSVRWLMWSSTMRMMAAHPLAGVGAGAWEVQAPLYQAAGAQLETDYYVHNEILQLLAEYGLVGWGFLLALLTYLANAAWRTVQMWRAWRFAGVEVLEEAALRFFTLLSLLSFLMVSNAGFPWRMAVTGALFAVCLGVLAASDARLPPQRWPHFGAQLLAWHTVRGHALLALSTLGLVLYGGISQQAAEAESKIVRAVKIALTVSASNQFNHPRWREAKAQMLTLLHEGIAINPHYRKLTPMVADELAKWGDWDNAVAVWESLVPSRPYVVAIMSNIARGYAVMGQFDKAQLYLARCQKLQPDAPSVRSLEVILLGQTGQSIPAWQLAKRSLAENIYDFDLVKAAYVAGLEHQDWALALQGMALLRKTWPQFAAESWVKTGKVYATPHNPNHDDAQALAAFQQGYDTASEPQKPQVLADLPEVYRGRIKVK
jgi:O-antigen ligase